MSFRYKILFRISRRKEALDDKSDIRFNRQIAATGSTISIADMVSNTPDGHVIHYYVHHSSMITDWGTKAQVYYADIKCARYGNTCSINVDGCDQGGHPIRYVGQKIGSSYWWSLVSTTGV